MEALYARIEHGGYPVIPLVGQGYQVVWPQGPVQYPSRRQTILALVHRTPAPPPTVSDPHLCFDRYFRRGRYSKVMYPTVDTLEMFQAPVVRTRESEQITIQIPDRPLLKGADSDSLLAIAPASVRVKRLPPVALPVRGIDLLARGHEVRKLFFAGFARRVFRYGYDPEDVLQEIYKGILIRNAGRCPFDEKKSSFGHYVHMVCGCIISNYRRRYLRQEKNEVFGVSNVEGEVQDVAQVDLASCDADQEDNARYNKLTEGLIREVRDAAEDLNQDPDLSEGTLNCLLEGMRYREIAEELGCSIGKVSDTVALIRRTAGGWDALARDWNIQALLSGTADPLGI